MDDVAAAAEEEEIKLLMAQAGPEQLERFVEVVLCEARRLGLNLDSYESGLEADS